VRVVWSRQASEQITRVFACFAAERPAVALRWLERVLERVESLAAFPDQGRLVPELQRSDMRELLIHPYRVVYRRDESEVIVVTVRHERRELGRDDATA
jgi:plasmid stabilization system protein ParE